MIENEAWKNILSTAKDFSTVAEIYGADTMPAGDGFDPADALDCFAAVGGIDFAGVEYKRLVKSFGALSRSITSEINSTSITFSNLTGEIANFEFAHGFEGLILVVRLLSRAQSDELSKSQILFVGRCEKPKSGKKDSLSVSAKAVLDALEVNIPRRKFTPQDYKGRESTDPEFEGFIYMPQTGFVSYSERVPRGGLLGALGFKKTVRRTLGYSSYSDLDANKPLPEVFGLMQILGVHIGYQDVGSFLKLRTTFCEGPIEDILNARSTNLNFPLNPGAYDEALGLAGEANGPDDPGWVAPGLYSKTAHIRAEADNSEVSVTDSAPDVVALIKGRILPVWDGSDWTTEDWTDNGAAVWRYLLTSPDYMNLDENWIDDEAAGEVFDFNNEQIFNVNTSDFLFLVE
jgi:hypothetical protein